MGSVRGAACDRCVAEVKKGESRRRIESARREIKRTERIGFERGSAPEASHSLDGKLHESADRRRDDRNRSRVVARDCGNNNSGGNNQLEFFFGGDNDDDDGMRSE